ncbi:MAG TPA: WG repeat-containing protein [Chryseosolibacter sp.]|nr:WG repeat-containing protein [Chryseosolibacter sp.]
MKRITATLVVITIIARIVQAQEPDGNNNRFAISENGQYGFIDRSGKVVIPLRFEQALEFSEGLCAVRTNGRYGFIDVNGDMRIPPVYDYATVFNEGLALVFLDGKPLFINTDGKPAFRSDFKDMAPFHDGRSYVRTRSGKCGIINKQGELVIDTVYKYIGEFKDGLAIVQGADHQEYDSDGRTKNLQMSVIDVEGHKLFPFGKYQSINDYNEGYFKVEFPEKNGGNVQKDGIINTKGDIVFQLPVKPVSWIEGGVHNGIIRVSLPSDKKENEFYDAYFAISGKKIFDKKSMKYGQDFDEGFAFIGNEEFNYVLINRKGEVISKELYDNIAGERFQNGRALVELDGGWGVIDTTGSVVLQTSYTEVYQNGLVNDKYIFFHQGDRWGVVDLAGKEIIPPVLEHFDERGFVNGLLHGVVDGRAAYYNTSGALLWQQGLSKRDFLLAVNIDYMNRGYFYADYNYLGHSGDGGRRAAPEPVTGEKQSAQNALSVVVHEDDVLPFFAYAKGFRVEVANTTSDTIHFNAQDNRLYMKVEAKDLQGKWSDIEYLPSSWCGNSYHTVSLPEGRYWTFVTPVYQGAIQTKLRISLRYVDPSELIPRAAEGRMSYRGKKELVVYSNEFNGSVNPAQFWRRPEYYPSGIMDPYNE